MLTLADLLAARTSDQWMDQLLLALKGVGYVSQKGTGTGDIALSGQATASYTALVTILTAGEPGVATFGYQLTDRNGIVTTGGPIVTPAVGTWALPSSGVLLAFNAGPTGSGDSFSSGDTFAFLLTTPTFPVTAWQEGGVGRTLAELIADALAEGDKVTSVIAAGGLVEEIADIGLSADAWGELLAKNLYDLPRNPAVTTQGLILFTDAGGIGPLAINPGTVWVTTASGLRYSNVNGGVLPNLGTLQLTFQAEQPGAAFNVGNNAITILITSLPGVTVNNPDPGSGTWITQAGVDKESLDALLLRCKERWPSLGQSAATKAVYDLWAKSASAVITRTRVILDPGVPGQVIVYLAGAAGGVAGGVVTLAQDYINARQELTATASVVSASNLAVQVTATIYVKASQLAAAQAAATTNLAAYINALPVGGDIAAGPGGIASREKLIAALAGISGVVDIAMSLPAADVAMTGSQVATLTQTLTWVTV